MGLQASAARIKAIDCDRTLGVVDEAEVRTDLFRWNDRPIIDEVLLEGQGRERGTGGDRTWGRARDLRHHATTQGNRPGQQPTGVARNPSEDTTERQLHRNEALLRETKGSGVSRLPDRSTEHRIPPLPEFHNPTQERLAAKNSLTYPSCLVHQSAGFDRWSPGLDRLHY